MGSRRFLRAAALLVCMLLLVQGAAAGGPSGALDSFWSANERVNDDAGTWLQDRPDVALDGAGNAYAVWRDLRNGTYDGHWDLDVYFSYRPAGGDWGANQRVNDDAGIEVQDWPALAVTADGDAYALWKDYRDGDPNLYFSHRSVGGTWSANERADDGGAADVDQPDMAVDSAGNLYAVWQDWRNGDPDVYFGFRPADGGWGANERISDAPAGTIQYSGALAVDGAGNAYAVWTDKRNGNADIYFSYRPQGGSWSANERVNDDPGAAEQWGPTLVVSGGGHAYAAWQDNRGGDYDIYASDRPPGGSWGANARVSDDSGGAHQYQAEIALGTDAVFVVWQDWRDGHADIYFSYCPTGGAWHRSERVNDDTGTAAQHDPVLAVDAQGSVFSAWADARSGDDDIYFSFRRAAPNRVFLPLVLDGR